MFRVLYVSRELFSSEMSVKHYSKQSNKICSIPMQDGEKNGTKM